METISNIFEGNGPPNKMHQEDDEASLLAHSEEESKATVVTETHKKKDKEKQAHHLKGKVKQNELSVSTKTQAALSCEELEKTCASSCETVFKRKAVKSKCEKHGAEGSHMDCVCEAVENASHGICGKAVAEMCEAQCKAAGLQVQENTCE